MRVAALVSVVLLIGNPQLALPESTGRAGSSYRETVDVRRSIFDITLVPRDASAGECRSVGPAELAVQIDGKPAAIRALDLAQTWEEGDQRKTACLNLVVYLGFFRSFEPYQCEVDPTDSLRRIRYTPPASFNPSFRTPVFRYAREMLENLAPCDRAMLYSKKNDIMYHTDWFHGVAEVIEGLSALQKCVTGQSHCEDSLLVGTPWDGAWLGIVGALTEVPGRKDLVVYDSSDLRLTTGVDPWTVADLAERARQAQVVIHRVDVAPTGRVDIPGSEVSLATGGELFRLRGEGEKILGTLRDRARCRYTVTVVPPFEKESSDRKALFHTLSVMDRTDHFDVKHPAYVTGNEQRQGPENVTPFTLVAGAGRDLGLELEDPVDCVPAGRKMWRCSLAAELVPLGSETQTVEGATVAIFSGSRLEYEHSYRFEPVACDDRKRVHLPIEMADGWKSLCLMVRGKDGRFLASACRSMEARGTGSSQ